MAAGLDRGTWHLMTGKPYLMRPVVGFRAPDNPVPGRDVAGTVVEVGSGVTRFAVGDAVLGIAPGSFAEYAVAREDRLAQKPAAVSFVQAAAVPISGITALQASRPERIRSGQSVLVLGASGGVGSYVVQLAKAYGAHVTGVASTGKRDLVRSLGADQVLDYTREDFADGTRRYDLIIDIAGNPTLSRLRRALNPHGTAVITGGEEGGSFSGGMNRQLRALALSVFVGQRLTMCISKENGSDVERLADLVGAGAVTPAVDRNVPLSRVPEAMRGARGRAGARQDRDPGRRREHVRGEVVITVEHLTKSYHGFTAVDDVSFTAAPGRVTGFLGPNGAGKSTTMRVVVGLTSADVRIAQVCGRQFRDLPNPGREVGVLLDASAQHAGRTGREILTIAQRTMGLSPARVEEMLSRVSLTPTEAGRRVRDYSLGMRQRLGIATALLGEPEVLILDEPANGLDPAGIRWMRDLLRGYADAGATVLLSSHLLHEIEVVADDLVVIGNGRIVARGTKADLLRSAGTLVRSPDRAALAAALSAAGVGHALGTGVGGADALRVDADPAQVGRVAHRADVSLVELRAADGTGLEEMFLELTAARPTRRSSSMSAIALEAAATRPDRTAPYPPVPLARIVSVELRKSFDTRTGFWLVSSIGIASVLATVGVALFATPAQLTYSTFVLAIGFPLAVILPMIAILSVTGEWSQRTGLTTFTLVPHRGRVVLAKGVVAVAVAVGSMLAAFVIGAVGNVVGTRVAGSPAVWDQDLVTLLDIVLANTLVVLFGFMLGVVVRGSAGAIVAYFVYAFLMPTVTDLLAASQQWFHDLQPWVDPAIAQHELFHGALTVEQWSQLGVTSLIWLVVPLSLGLRALLRSR